MEVQFTAEVAQLRLGAGQVFHGEGILAITKALLQSGVAYVGGYQGAPVSHLLDVMVQARTYLQELGVHVEACSNEASAAAMLGASLHYPVRGAVTWKSIVGTNVAADALSNLASPGVVGGALIVSGEDYGEGASVIQERTHAFAMKSTLLLLDPRPDHEAMVRMVEHAFAMSEASNMPAILQLRIRACHVRGSFVCKDNVAPAVSGLRPIEEPAPFSYAKLAHPPVTFGHEKLKVEQRIPAAQAYIERHGLNERFDAGDLADIGIVAQGGLHNSLVRALEHLGLADAFGASRVPLLVLNVTYPLVPAQIVDFASNKRALLVLEEGAPEYIEKDILAALHRAGSTTQLHGKATMAAHGEYNVEVLARGIAAFCDLVRPGVIAEQGRAWLAANDSRRAAVTAAWTHPLPPRPPTFCVGCPERPVFSALKLAQQNVGRVHIAADIGCHAFATFEPFSSGHSILGYGMSLASRAGVSPLMQRRTLAVMGDGGFWHNGLLTGVQSALFNGDDAVLLIMKNGYTSATGTQELISTPDDEVKARAEDKQQSLVDQNLTIEGTLQGMGVKWLRRVDNYDVDAMRRTLEDAFTTDFAGLKVIVAEGECQLERQRRTSPWIAQRLARRERVVRVKYGVDEDVCTGDHACIRLSGCPTLTLKDNPDPLRADPVATVIDGCVGCGLCGSNAHAATLCPSFYRAEVVKHPRWGERAMARMRTALLPRAPLAPATPAGVRPEPSKATARVVPSMPRTAWGEPDAGGGQKARPDPARVRARAFTLLVCALGGEGGGVLADWLVAVARACGHAAQGTSIPGVAQRTGATTYYLEFFPRPASEHQGRKPVFGLYAVPGAVDLLVGTELLEVARQAQAGMISPDRTAVIASTRRTLTTAEKMVPADGRVDDAELAAVVQAQAASLDLLDMGAMAARAGTVVSAVMLGAIGAWLSASGRLPFPRAAYEAVIRDGGKRADASLAGFADAWDRVTAALTQRERAMDPAAQASRTLTPEPAAASPSLPRSLASGLPAAAHAFAALGHARVLEYQDEAYAALYAQRLRRVWDAERSGGGEGETTAEAARWLALWMAFDDIARVAQAKGRAERFERVRREAKAAPEDLVRVFDHFKPGVPEFAAMLPPALAASLRRWDARRAAAGQSSFAWPLKLASHTLRGRALLALLASMRHLRRAGSRYADEQHRIEQWLAALERGAREHAALGVAIARCGRLNKGYGATHDRGWQTIEHLIAQLAFAPAAGDASARAAAVSKALDAALAEDTGSRLDQTLAAHGAPPRPVREQPIRWHKRVPRPLEETR